MEQVQKIENNTSESLQNLTRRTGDLDNKVNSQFFFDYVEELKLRNSKDYKEEIVKHNNSDKSEKEKSALTDEKLYSRPSSRNNAEHSKSSQKWIGYIEEINEETFKVKLFDLYKDDTYELAEFYNDEVSPDDKDLFKEGGVFYWSVGFEVRNGQRKSESILRFKRSVESSNELNNQVIDTSEDLLNGLSWEQI